jgi:hypothetical protein
MMRYTLCALVPMLSCVDPKLPILHVAGGATVALDVQTVATPTLVPSAGLTVETRDRLYGDEFEDVKEIVVTATQLGPGAIELTSDQGTQTLRFDVHVATAARLLVQTAIETPAVRPMRPIDGDTLFLAGPVEVAFQLVDGDVPPLETSTRSMTRILRRSNCRTSRMRRTRRSRRTIKRLLRTF